MGNLDKIKKLDQEIEAPADFTSPEVLYNELIAAIRKYHPSDDISMIEKAYQIAYDAHKDQRRKSGEPYIIHPLCVAIILADLELDKETLVAGILHDVVEDTVMTEEEITAIFGEEVALLVDGVTKLTQISWTIDKVEIQAENLRKMFLAMAKDIRVILIKLADRLHNMRTLQYMKPEKQKEKARETMDIYAPIADRLGISKIKTELDDLSLKYLQPEVYKELSEKLALRKDTREAFIHKIMDEVKKHMDDAGIEAKVDGRVKHFFSIYKKMVNQDKTLDQIYDIFAVRIIVESVKDCYAALGVIHEMYKPIPGRFKDYIAMPKGNMYQSLHTSVIGPRQKPLEVQIRTWEMHEIAEYGIAAHWRYKEKGSRKADSASDIKFSWMRKLVEYNKETKNAEDFVNSVKLDLFSDQVFAFTPGGDVIDLPQGATPIDFAYRIHSDVGHKTVGALINGRIAQLDTKLKNGDIVEIMTSKVSAPRLDWLNFVVTKQAASRIRQWYKKNKREDHIEIGKANLEHELTKTVFDEYVKNGEFDKVAKQMNYVSGDDLFAALGYGETTVNKIINRLRKPPKQEGPANHKPRKASEKDIVGLEGLLYSFARCCSPIPGEPIVGVVTRSKGVTVHRLDCKTLENIPVERLIDIHWSGNNINKTYSTTIRIETAEKMGLLKDIIGVVSDNNTNINSANVKSKGKVGIIELGIELDNIYTLRKVMTALQSMPDVFSVKRIQTSYSHAPQQFTKKNNKPQKKRKKTSS